jgi:hypothetical protein
VFERLNVADVAPGTEAVAVYGPAFPFAVTVAVAIPAPFVIAVAVPILAPLPGPENVTVAPPTGFPPISFTTTDSGAGKAVLTVVLWLFPPVAVTVAGEPGRFVTENVAGFATPLTLALTEYGPAALLAVKAGEVATPDEFV